METQREAAHVHQTGPSETEAFSSSSDQIQRREPAAAADPMDLSVLSSLCPPPVGRVVSASWNRRQ